MTGESLYPRDLIERLRGALDERERIAVPATRRLYPGDPAIAAMTAEALRTIQAHRKIADRHAPIIVDMTEMCGGCGQVYAFGVCPDVRDLASIYFPESDATDG